MKVLIVTNMMPTRTRPYLGIFVAEQAESLRRAGCAVDIAAHVADPSRGAYWHALWDVRRRLRLADYDVIHSHHSYSTLIAAAARRLAGRRVPIVMTFHESEVFARGADYGQDRLRRLKYARWLKRRALLASDRVIAVQRDMTRRVMGDAAARLRETVIPAGIDLERFTPGERAEARRRMGWPERGLCVLFPCDPEKPEKRADLAREGFERWRETVPEKERRAAWLAVGGGIDYARMPDALRAADVVLVPTDYEASPTVVKEALACEVPVVSTDVGDVRERFGDLPGVRICGWEANGVAAAIAEAVGVARPFGGRQALVDQQLDLPQVARRVMAVYGEAVGLPAENRT